MRLYKDWSPSGFDVKGLNLPDRQWWYVVPVILTRDSDPMEESNFYAAQKMLDKVGPADVERHSFNHWACGWFDIMIVRPNTDAERIARDIEAAIDNYPVIDENDLSEREQTAADEIWRGCYSESERLEYIRRYRSQFDFRNMADLMSCVRGKYFAGYASELVYR